MKSSNFLKNSKGYMMATAGASLVMFMSFFALVVDFGHIFVTKSQLQNSADAAALAAIVEVPLGVEAAHEKAMEFGQSHYVAGSHIQIDPEDIVFGHYDLNTSSFESGSEPVNALTVTAKRVQSSPSGALPLFFAPFFGKRYSDVQAQARVFLDPRVVGVRQNAHIIPYSVYYEVVDQNNDGQYDVGSTIDVFPRNNAPGNFGWLDLDEGSNGTPELRVYIEEGYDGDFVIPPGGSIIVDGTPGIRGQSLLPSFSLVAGQIVFLPVHNSVTNTGSTAEYNVINLLAVTIGELNLTGSQDGRYIETTIVSVASSSLIVSPEASAHSSLSKPRFME